MYPIYLHGLGQTPASWENIIAQLDFTGCSKCPDLIEICQGQPATYKNLYAGFSKTCSELDGPIDLCGLSLGGVLALNYTIEHPEKVNSLVLIATQYKMPKGLLKFQNILFQFMPNTAFQQTGFSKVDFLQLCKTMMELDFGNLIQKITCPTLVICGEKDYANKKAARELACIIKNAELQVIEGSGHEVNRDAPERLAEVLRAFYRQVQ